MNIRWDLQRRVLYSSPLVFFVADDLGHDWNVVGHHGLPLRNLILQGFCIESLVLRDFLLGFIVAEIQEVRAASRPQIFVCKLLELLVAASTFVSLEVTRVSIFDCWKALHSVLLAKILA